MKFLKNINSPQDLKKLKISHLKALAQEIRDYIVEVTSKNGGHVAPNLGVVELTLALHYVFDSPKDKIIWDVGHQCYTHKLITGRRDQFHTLRQYEGIAGFPKRAESPHDILDTGHSSTSISAGLGMATALRLKKEKGKVIAVIGDGSITAGLAFEGLNNAGFSKEDLLVVLNDNEMSIAPNVGALSSFISKRLTGNLVRFIKREIESISHKVPGGENLLSILKKGEELLKVAITPGALFTALNFEYVGPVDGHNLEELIKVLNNLKSLKGPVLLHVITKKGKGYPYAEADPETFHGIGPFDVKTGKPLKSPNSPPSYTEIFGRTMLRLAEIEPKLVAITAAMRSGTGLKEFSERYPERFFDVGICEQHAVTFAAGLALEGFIPVCAIYSTFLQRAFDQIIHDVALNQAKVIFALDRAGLVGEDGPTHHGAFDLSYLRLIPNLVIMVPKDENELQHMLYSALKYPNPVAIRYPRGAGVGVSLDWEFKEIPFGKGEVLKSGKDLTILAVGSMVYPALKAALEAEKFGLSVEVINARFVKPLDEDLILSSAQKTKRVLLVEENTLIGGFGSAVLELLTDKGIKGIEVKRLGLPDKFIEHGDLKTLHAKYHLNTEGILLKIKEFLG
ncbi:MAG: 1-deoxy-D-xylulose-5-phosphate synthase [Thermodesulfobacterium sp. 37_54]|nr:1-deoxy-D-xylulose-5-phosphate synthase [Thermodesulfobacterium commune]KUJ97550.1 MAG: 1-deoxy-D-xylulose-5-phosphate synthase [Thermodesulfobacterium sp. 37_54]KUK19300.1 MAG: 1-deoxy-D-xylulose-5-phosphate synthase [Thermodesulfobacterium commune]HBT04713.1 1-deoxy-D-xylulose-5-phosphate synthase [Thermodesulfobacterium commune]HCE79688.1 1-deoxy-D-xylulose-5-phosphate synthase [Thermodesulfobacterium commune]HCP10174.1 1-deoxy-D-xylulose-5-phosphate synthase [Thermodesulfobacterium comm